MASDYKLLLNFEDRLADSSPAGHTITTSGITAVSTTQAKFGTQSVKFTGSADKLNFADSDDWTPSGDFTIDLWFYFVTLEPSCSFWHHASGDSDFVEFRLQAGTLAFLIKESNTTEIDLNSTPTITTDVWHHVAVTRSGDDWYLFYDGVKQDSANKSYAFPNFTATDIYMRGTHPASIIVFFDEFRFLNGKAAWVNNFAPSTRPYMEFIEEGIIQRLLASSSVYDLVENKLYPEVAPNEATPPYIVYSLTSSTHHHVMGGSNGIVEDRVELVCWESTVGASRILADEVRKSLDAYSGALGNNYAQSILLDSDSTDFTLSEKTRSKRRFGVRHEYIVTHSEINTN
jgi:hypothetical protein